VVARAGRRPGSSRNIKKRAKADVMRQVFERNIELLSLHAFRAGGGDLKLPGFQARDVFCSSFNRAGKVC
jgi:hypothetical protein